MKIAFLDPAYLHYTPETPFSRPLGGTQSAACFLSAALAKRGHSVSLITRTATSEKILGVDCQAYDTENIAQQLNDHDFVVVLTSPIAASLRKSGVTAKLINWQHMTANSANVSPFSNEEEILSWDNTVFVSNFQKSSFVDRWNIDGNVIRNAISPIFEQAKRSFPTFVERGEDPVLVYASAPGRGLDSLLMSFPTIRKHLPNSKLKIFSDQSMYQVSAENDKFSVYYELAKNIPGVEYVGCVSQTELSDEMMSSDIWSYPTTFIETSCIVMMEAGASGCLLAGSDIGALSETSGRFGRLLKPIDSRAGWCGAYAKALVREVQRIRASPEGYRGFIDAQMQWFRESCTWARRAEEWEVWLSDLPMRRN